MRPLDIYASVVQEVLSNNASDRAQGFPSFDRRDIQEVTRNAFKDKTTYFPYSINPTVTDDMIRQALLTIYVGNEDIEERSKGFFQK
jgi:hypothetical protein